jgi:hypothetical protein
VQIVVDALVDAARITVPDKNHIVELPCGEWEVSFGYISDGTIGLYGFTYYLPSRTTTWNDAFPEGEDSLRPNVEEMVDAWFELLTVEDKLCISARETASPPRSLSILSASTRQPAQRARTPN